MPSTSRRRARRRTRNRYYVNPARDRARRIGLIALVSVCAVAAAGLAWAAMFYDKTFS